MQVLIKSFNVNMEVKSKGVEFEVKDNDGNHLGDLVLTKTALFWCKGRTSKEKGVPITWKEFIEYADNKPQKKRRRRRVTPTVGV